LRVCHDFEAIPALDTQQLMLLFRRHVIKNLGFREISTPTHAILLPLAESKLLSRILDLSLGRTMICRGPPPNIETFWKYCRKIKNELLTEGDRIVWRSMKA
jgi:hypothetical protein